MHQTIPLNIFQTIQQQGDGASRQNDTQVKRYSSKQEVKDKNKETLEIVQPSEVAITTPHSQSDPPQFVELDSKPKSQLDKIIMDD